MSNTKKILKRNRKSNKIINHIKYTYKKYILYFVSPGIGVVLVTISGVAWKVTTANNAHCLGIEGTEFEHCGRQQCIRNSSMSHGLLYPEFQHRAPPPTYQASMQEYRLRWKV